MEGWNTIDYCYSSLTVELYICCRWSRKYLVNKTWVVPATDFGLDIIQHLLNVIVNVEHHCSKFWKRCVGRWDQWDPERSSVPKTQKNACGGSWNSYYIITWHSCVTWPSYGSDTIIIHLNWTWGRQIMHKNMLSTLWVFVLMLECGWSKVYQHVMWNIKLM